MAYLKIPNLYKEQEILLFKRCYALEKIHGTSAHVRFHDDKLTYFSGGASYHEFLGIFSNNPEWNEDEIKEKFIGKFGYKCDVTIFGEAYGGKMQGMSDVYGDKLKFIAFDVKVNDKWLNVPAAENVANAFSIEFVHYEEIDTSLEELEKVKEQHSIQAIRNGMGEGKESEGVVLRPLIELTQNNGNRIITKHKRDKFRETATKRNIIDPDKLQVLEEAKSIAEEWVTPMRLEHVLDKIEDKNITNMKNIIIAMQDDVRIEAEGEIVWGHDVAKAIGTKTVSLFKERLKKNLEETAS